MNFLKLKSILFGLIAVFAVAALLTSCEQDTINNLEEEVALQDAEQSVSLRAATSLSWNSKPTRISNSSNSIKVNYKSSQGGFIVAQLFDCNWKQIDQDDTSFNKGEGKKTFTLNGSKACSGSKNYIEVKIYDSNWIQKRNLRLNATVTKSGGSGGSNNLSWSGKPSSLVNGTNSISVNYSSSQLGILVAQVFDCNWKQISDSRINVKAGSGRKTLKPAVRGLCSKDNYVQIKLLGLNGKEIASKLQATVKRR